MALRIVVHIHNEDPFVAEIDQMPDPKDNFIMVRNPRKRDGKAMTLMSTGATSFIYPWSRISFIEVLDGAADRENIVGFFREDNRAMRG